MLLVFAFSASLVRAQTFDLEQFEQIFRPRLRLEGRYMPETAFRDTSGHFGSTDGTAVITFPIRSHFDVGMKLDTSARGLGDLLKKSIRVQASQVLGNVRLGARQVELGFDSAATRNLYSASLGMLGVKLTRTYRVLFWSANVNVSEEDATFDRAALRCNAVIGQLHGNGLRRQFPGMSGPFGKTEPVFEFFMIEVFVHARANMTLQVRPGFRIDNEHDTPGAQEFREQSFFSKWVRFVHKYCFSVCNPVVKPSLSGH